MPAPSHLVVIAASAGGVQALLDLAARLPKHFPAAVCIVLHVGDSSSILPELLGSRGPNPAVHAADGQRLEPGHLYVAPPDYHMLVDRERIRLTRGPKENHVRPAADPLFRTAALAWGGRCIGVVLTGFLDDGTAGLRAIKDCGGIAVVQDPATAVQRGMPESALRHVDVDHCVPLDALADTLVRLVGQAAPVDGNRPPETITREVAINQGEATMENLAQIAAPSTLTCPDCGGSLWEVRREGAARQLRYRCHTGHAYGERSLAHAQAEATEHALRSGVRALRERELLVRRLADVAAAVGDDAQARAGRDQAERLSRQVEALIEMTQAEAMSPVVANSGVVDRSA